MSTKTRKQHNRDQTRKNYEYWRESAIFVGAIEDERKLLVEALEEMQRLKQEHERLKSILEGIKKQLY